MIYTYGKNSITDIAELHNYIIIHNQYVVYDITKSLSHVCDVICLNCDKGVKRFVLYGQQARKWNGFQNKCHNLF